MTIIWKRLELKNARSLVKVSVQSISRTDVLIGTLRINEGADRTRRKMVLSTIVLTSIVSNTTKKQEFAHKEMSMSCNLLIVLSTVWPLYSTLDIRNSTVGVCFCL